MWNTSMLFFQITLLAGYTYSHFTTRFLSVHNQAILHICLLALFSFVLPFAIPEGRIPASKSNPALWQLILMASVIGGPFFILSGTAPMLQRWFSKTNHPDAGNPYFLYGASNLGSMSALLSYPILIEPNFTLGKQSLYWTYGYLTLIMTIIIAAIIVWKQAKPEHAPTIKSQTSSEKVHWRLRGYWAVMAFLPSSLMLGVTTYITTDIASTPLFWIVPLSIYVGSFILVFSRKKIMSMEFITNGFSISVALMLINLITWNSLDASISVTIIMITFFFAAMLCHTLLANSRPPATHLTEFYLIMSVGGALGGFFNAIITPMFFIIPIEFALILVITIFLRHSDKADQTFAKCYKNFVRNAQLKKLDLFFELPVIGLILIVLVTTTLATTAHSADTIPIAAAIFAAGFLLLYKTRWVFSIACMYVFLLFPPGYNWLISDNQKVLMIDRNFFGAMRIIDFGKTERVFIHGTTTHGSQAIDEKYQLIPIGYYSALSPLSDIFDILDLKSSPQRVALMGLGVGSTLCYQKPDRHYDIFEIDPDVAAIAENKEYFTYLSDCGSGYDIHIGDARLNILREENSIYDLIFIDTYSSDNIPIHIITIEALRSYMKKLKDGGIIAFNISNRHLDLEPVVHKAAKELEAFSISKVTNAAELKDGLMVYSTQYAIITKNSNTVNLLKHNHGWEDTSDRKSVNLWTDDYSNIISVWGNHSAIKRLTALQKDNKTKQ